MRVVQRFHLVIQRRKVTSIIMTSTHKCFSKRENKTTKQHGERKQIINYQLAD